MSQHFSDSRVGGNSVGSGGGVVVVGGASPCIHGRDAPSEWEIGLGSGESEGQG